MASSSILGTVEHLLNQGLATDPEFLEALGEHAGKRLHVIPEGWGGRLEARVAALGVELEWLSDGAGHEPACAPLAPEPDVEVRASPGVLLALLGAGPGATTLAAAGVKVRGDVHTLEALRRLAATLQVDWEELLAMRMGDVAAHQVMRGMRAVKDHARDSVRGLASSTAEWLKYETRALPTPGELAQYCEAVDDVREQYDRLEARLVHIERKRRQGVGAGKKC